MENLSAATSTNAVAPVKSHYVVLDGLRGVAALTVVAFHITEAFYFGDPIHHIINHGYLAVDFFFLLSGFVIAYAYDDRWPRMGQWEFYKRRLIRLQPMVVMGSLIGGALFYLQKGSYFPIIAATPVWKMLLVMLLGCTLLPLPLPYDIRGWQEMHPLNGPAWSLFFEYLANIFYAVGLRKASKRVLAVLAFLAACLLVQVAVFGKEGDLIGGWSLDGPGLHVGFARLLFPFIAGMLLMRSGRRIHVPYPFAVSALILLVALCWPRVGGAQHLWWNGIYDAFCVMVVFPLVIAIGAGEKRVEGGSIRVARFFGDLSYPLYITHYPLIYIFTAWVAQRNVSTAQGMVWGVVLFITAITIAWICLKMYDEPLRRWLSRRFLIRTASPLGRNGG